MKNIYDFKISVLACSNCNAPIKLTVSEGASACSFCGFENVSIFPKREKFKRAESDNVPELKRLSAFLAQASLPESTLSNSEDYVKDGVVLEWKLQELTMRWKEGRKVLASKEGTGAEEEQFSYLTALLGQYYLQKENPLQVRGIYETALELLTEPKYRQHILGWLSQSAALENDIYGANQWLAMCDPASVDFKTDSIFRISQATIFAKQQKWNKVLEVLGDHSFDVPIIASLRAKALVLKAGAFEKINKQQESVAAIVKFFSNSNQQKTTFSNIIDEYKQKDILLCSESFDLALTKQNETSYKHSVQSMGLTWLFLSLGILILMVCISAIVYFLVFSSKPIDAIFPLIFLVFGIVPFVIGTVSVIKKRALYRINHHGIEAEAKITSVEFNNVWVNNERQLNLVLDVYHPEQTGSYEVVISVLPSECNVHIKRGKRIPIKIDSKNPKHVIVA